VKRTSFLLAGAGAALAGCAGSAVPSVSATTAPPTAPGPEGRQLLGSLLLTAFEYETRDYVRCDGRLLPINDTNAALFALLSDRFGGRYPQTFALPDLRGRAPIEHLQYTIAINGVFPLHKNAVRRQAPASAPLIGQLLLVPYVAVKLPPRGWLECDGRELDIKGHQELFAVIGYTFGGTDRGVTFTLPDLRGHAPLAGLTYLIAVEGRYPSRA
jgi:microcystin-dependent protein